MAAVAVFTALFGDFDIPPAQQAEQDIDVAWYAFTDHATFPAPWKTIVVDDMHGCPRLAAKHFKCSPTTFLAEQQSIWIDANTEIISATFAREALDAMHDNIALYAHPQRDCIYLEASASLRLAPKKYRHTPIRAQAAHYRAEGHPAHGGLYACGTIARTHNPQIVELGRRWWTECVRWTYQDQLSFPVVCRQLELSPGRFDHRQIGARTHFGNRWQILHPHRSDR
jgi:hypothetical protein